MLKNLQLKKLLKYICTHKISIYLLFCYAEVAQLVELQPSKLVVASSSLVFRSLKSRNILFRLFYFKLLKSEPDSSSTASWFCKNKRAFKSPFKVTTSPFTSSQLPSRNPKTGIALKA